MIGIAENNLGPDVPQVIGSECLDGGLSADRHEDRCFERAVRGREHSDPCPGIYVPMQDAKIERHGD